MTKTADKSIIFIAGTFIANNCWDEWKLYFEDNGYICIAPPWPNKKHAPEVLRNRHPDPNIASIDLEILIEYYAEIVKQFQVQPILIGHSFGGLIVQLLLQRGLGIAGIAIHSLPPNEVSCLQFSLLRKWLGSMGFFTPIAESYLVSFNRWRFVIANGLSFDQEKKSYYDYAVPESKLIIRDAFRSDYEIDFKCKKVPLLFTSGGKDRLIPASLNLANYKKYKLNGSITNYQVFKGHTHLVFSPGEWMKEADFILYWLQGIKR